MRDRLVLGYHAVSDRSASPRAVTRAALRRQVAGLVGRGYVGATFSRALLGPSPPRCLAVTFDDGEHSVIEHAFPVLAALGVPGTVFVPVSPIGAPGLLGWADLATLSEAGWEVGAHTLSHARLTDIDDASLGDELRGSREAIEDTLGRPCRSLAYPYGAVDARVRAAAARAGFTAGCTTGTTGTVGRADVLVWPRVGVDGDDGRTLFRLKTSRVGRALRGTPLRAPLERTGRRVRSLASR
ncbi:MAG: polysaccharide deacetylase family protein [Gaiellaceae bacterium]